MNPIQKLLREQKEEFENKFICDGEPKPYPVKLKGSWKGIVTGDMIQDWHTTAQQQLIDAIIDGMKVFLSAGIQTNGTYNGYSDGYNEALQTQINLLEEAKKNI